MRKITFLALSLVIAGVLASGCGFSLGGGEARTGETRETTTKGFEGTYQVEGPDYNCSLSINKVSETYHVIWSFADGSRVYGKGLELGGVLGVVFADEEGYDAGVVVYKRDGDGITGLWTTADGEVLFAEKTPGADVLRKGTPDVRGLYGVTGTNDDGSAYTGSLEIADMGQTLAAMWLSGESEIYGTGFVADNVLVIGFGNDAGIGIAIYEISDGTLAGNWTFALYEELATPTTLFVGEERAIK